MPLPGFKAQDPSNVDPSKFSSPQPLRTVQGVMQSIAAQLAPEQRASTARQQADHPSGGHKSGGVLSFFTSSGPMVGARQQGRAATGAGRSG
jgi:hypothetical protein